MTRIRKAPPGSKPIYTAAETETETETPEAAIKRLLAESQKYRDRWRDATHERDRALKRVTELETSLRSITILSRAGLGELVEQANHIGNIPF